ncbi:MAG: hypothetical protein IJN57_12535 [Oscillospiraceae bacterium]|nr:hypothetical protein [Oscillospiraceae bacterium]
MAQYGNPDSMRQDALRRSREMQRRTPVPEPKPAAPVRGDFPPPAQPAAPSLPKELQGLLQGWDGERLALLALLYLLYREGADPRLLLAIGYVLL